MDTEAEAARHAWQVAEERRNQVPIGSPAWREAVWTATLEREVYLHLSRRPEPGDSRVRVEVEDADRVPARTMRSGRYLRTRQPSRNIG